MKNETKPKRGDRCYGWSKALTQYRLGCIEVDLVRVNCISAFGCTYLTEAQALN